MNVKIVLAWIPGHQGIPANDTADCLAKETAREIYRGQLAASCYKLTMLLELQLTLQGSHGKGSGIKMFLVVIPEI